MTFHTKPIVILFTRSFSKYLFDNISVLNIEQHLQTQAFKYFKVVYISLRFSDMPDEHITFDDTKED